VIFYLFRIVRRVTKSFVRRIIWKDEPQRVIAPYSKMTRSLLFLFSSTPGHEKLGGIRQN